VHRRGPPRRAGAEDAEKEKQITSRRIVREAKKARNGPGPEERSLSASRAHASRGKGKARGTSLGMTTWERRWTPRAEASFSEEKAQASLPTPKAAFGREEPANGYFTVRMNLNA
jgi:hypothetical protein